MSPINRRLLRAACRLQNAYAAATADCARIDLPQRAWDELQPTHRAWISARDRDWHAAATRQRESLAGELDYLVGQLQSRLTLLRRERQPPVPQLRLLYEELVAADAEFDGVTLDAGEVSVTTESIVLDDIPLGRFQIRLHLKRLGGDTPYSITALDQNPAASSPSTTHPHVSDSRLCPGEGRAAINAALAEGRLLDFFTVVDRNLHHYAPGAAFVELDEWSCVSCHDCDSSVAEEDASTCTQCEEQVCGDCLSGCGGCGDSFCSGCIDRCRRCEEFVCGGCLTTCTCCRRAVCGACREAELCETCREQWEEEQNEMASSETTSQASDASP